jgi:hypothetical protein
MDREVILNSLGIRKVDPQIDTEVVKSLNSSAGIFSGAKLTDFGRIRQCGEPFWLFTPVSSDQAIEGLEVASSLGMSIRARGAGHSINGSSLPKRDEVLISTLGLNHIRRISDNVIQVGSGAQVWTVDQYLRQYGCSLPVVHDGDGPAPTVGGFFCAGGFGVESKRYGGFWNHVASLRLWSKAFGMRTINSDEDAFWDFVAAGNMPNSVIISVDLRICGTLVEEVADEIKLVPFEHPRLLWFTFVTSARASSRLYKTLAELNEELKENWTSLNPYSYYIKSLGRHRAHNFYPPTDSDLIAAGVWGSVKEEATPDHRAILNKVNQALRKLPNVYRYWQSEL